MQGAEAKQFSTCEHRDENGEERLWEREEGRSSSCIKGPLFF